MQRYWLGYLFVSFAVGVACLGVAVSLAVRRRDAVSRAFLAFYAALSIMVTASLVLAFADAAPGEISGSIRQVFEYLESIVGFYGLMLTLPLFAHRVFGVDDRRRERLLVATVLATLGLQHVTEFALASTPWDERGDWLENGVLIVIVIYAFWVAYSHLGSADAHRPLAPRVFAMLVLGAPGGAYDIFFGEGSSLRIYPLWYCVTSVVVTWTLVQGEAEPKAARPRVADRWGLSERETEVADGVARGLSNKDIAAALHISPNTVKTHLRTIFEKAGVRSRFELISRMSGL
ncbi:MAG: helix-turn-helix transcriptional regulator [bacterium]|nr:helix-turn-helix transcriptional regulator [bacterium]